MDEDNEKSPRNNLYGELAIRNYPRKWVVCRVKNYLTNIIIPHNHGIARRKILQGHRLRADVPVIFICNRIKIRNFKDT